MSAPPTTYGTVTKIFHWTTALLILMLIPMGMYANQLPFETSAELARKAQVFSIHKTLGVLVFFVALARILWAMSHAKPGPLYPERKAETFVAELIHWLLYGSLVVVPLSGWIHHAATTGFAPIWWPFGQNLPLVPKDETLAELFGGFHWILTKVLAASLFLHLAGAAKHVVIDRDSTLSRMWFGKSKAPKVPAHRTPAAAPLGALVIFIAAFAAAYAFKSNTHAGEGATVAALEDVESDWEVLDGGTLAITILQLGSEVTGTFSEWTADISFDADAGPTFGEVTATIAIGSLSLGTVTDQAMGADYFDVANFPTATFRGPITSDGGATYRVDGELELKGITAPLTLYFDLLEQDDGTWLMQGATQIDRMGYNIGLAQDKEGTLGFGVDVDIDFFARQAE